MTGSGCSDRILIVITGPTGSGKTALAIELARRLCCDIISADSRQIYRGMPICTATPTPAELSEVKHHLVQCLDPSEYYSAARFEEDALKLLEEQWERGSFAVICGGSMMYVDAVTDGIDLLPTISQEIRTRVASVYEEEGTAGIISRLRALDPAYLSSAPDLSNHKRLMHALEICLEAGVPYSSLRTGRRKERPFRVLRYALELPREELFDRINRRVEHMVKQGLVEEVRSMIEHRGENSLNTVGVKEILRYIDGEWDLPTAVARLQKNTRVYAKKQLTWLRRRNDTIWLDPSTALSDILADVTKLTDQLPCQNSPTT